MTEYTDFLFEADETVAGERLDKALATHPDISSRSQATSLIDRGFVTMNGVAVKPSHRVRPGERFEVRVPVVKESELTPYALPLDIVYEDEHLLVVNKPPGLVVHPAYGHAGDTLVNALIHHARQLAPSSAPGRPGIVHRLDKETSGLLVVAKTDTALSALAKQFKRKTVHRIYWAVAYGHFKQMEGTITSYIRRHPTDRKRFASERLTELQEPQGKLAITHYRAVKNLPCGLSLVHLRLETGRTHQIRVHLSEAQHPIVGDPVYCGSHRPKSIASMSLRRELQANNRLFLHAAELGFVHPATQETLRFKADWPGDIAPLLRMMGASNL